MMYYEMFKNVAEEKFLSFIQPYISMTFMMII